jgi:hypothetical protein
MADWVPEAAHGRPQGRKQLVDGQAEVQVEPVQVQLLVGRLELLVGGLQLLDG